jgi:hypothetical protein
LEDLILAPAKFVQEEGKPPDHNRCDEGIIHQR